VIGLGNSPGTQRATGLHLNGATIMTTPTDTHVRIARDSGYAGVELRAERLLAPGADAELRAAASIVREGEVWSLNGIQIKVDADGALRLDLLDAELPPRLAICEALRARYLLVVPPRIAGVDGERALPGIIDGLSRIRDAAAAVGLRAAFEFLGFADCPIDTPALAAKVIAAVPGTDLVLDSCHWHASGSAALDDFPVERLAMVHLNDAPPKPPSQIADADRLLPNLGVIRLRALIGQLELRGYDGPWSLETFNPEYWSEDPAVVAQRGRVLTETVLSAASGS
jgi:sugar phosphate isomerase/epimerase